MSRFDLTSTQKEVYTQQVHDAYAASAMTFKNMVSFKQEGAKGARILFEIMESLVGGKVGAAGTNSQNSAGGDIEQVWVYPEEYIAEFFYRQLEFDQSGEYLKPKYAQRVIDAVRVLEDISISTLWNDDANFVDRYDGVTERIVKSGGDGSAGLSFELLMEAKSMVDKYATNSGAKIYLITDYHGSNELMKIEQYTNNDYLNRRTLEGGSVNGMNHLGFEHVVVPNLGDNLYGGYKHIKAGEIVFMLQDALCFGTNSGLESVVARIPDRQSSYITQAIANFDAKVLDSNGIAKIQFTVGAEPPTGN
jgi:hypothetical protein